MTTNEANVETTEVVTAAPGVTKKRPVKKSVKKAATKKATKAVKAAKKSAVKREKKAKELPLCRCGCNQKTAGGKFIPGHDARFHGRVKKLADGRLAMADLVKELGKSGEYALESYKEDLKHAPKTPYVKPVRKTATGKASAKGKPSGKGGGSGRKGAGRKTAKKAAGSKNTKDGSQGQGRADGATGEAKETARVAALRAIDKAGELSALDVAEAVGVRYSLKNMLKKAVKDGHLSVTNYPREGSDQPGPDMFSITDSGRDYYKSLS